MIATILELAGVWVFAIILLPFVILFAEPTFSIVFSSAPLPSQTLASSPELHSFPLTLLLSLMTDLTASHPYYALSLFRYSFTTHLTNQICYCFSSSFCSPASSLYFSLSLMFIILSQKGPGRNLKDPLGQS